MNRELARQIQSSPRSLDGIDIANKIRYCDIRSCQLLNVTLLWTQICNRCFITFFGDEVFALPAQRLIGIVVNLASLHVRKMRIEQTGKSAQHAALRLSTKAEQDEIVPR